MPETKSSDCQGFSLFLMYKIKIRGVIVHKIKIVGDGSEIGRGGFGDHGRRPMNLVSFEKSIRIWVCTPWVLKNQLVKPLKCRVSLVRNRIGWWSHSIGFWKVKGKWPLEIATPPGLEKFRSSEINEKDPDHQMTTGVEVAWNSSSTEVAEKRELFGLWSFFFVWQR